ncbi:hypothetical protein [Thiocapsa roseopersicina]|uniref:hypothetical protein n=1 Tax=Thiocapsa roseopersicina TaxID=1058 RepID=UPI001587E5D3|nr:hypothetical protein [Thiocapsa roseopersicina]
MQLRIGFEWNASVPPGPTPMISALCIQDSRASDFGPNTPEGFQVWTDEVAGP